MARSRYRKERGRGYRPAHQLQRVRFALAGFAAIALVLGQREGALPSGSAYVVQFMVINALGPALLAAVLLLLDIPEPLLFLAFR
jgi:hypothetical protein